MTLASKDYKSRKISKYAPWILEEFERYENMPKADLIESLVNIDEGYYSYIKNYYTSILTDGVSVKMNVANVYYDKHTHRKVHKGDKPLYMSFKRLILANYPLDFNKFEDMVTSMPRTSGKKIVKRVLANPNLEEDLILWLRLYHGVEYNGGK